MIIQINIPIGIETAVMDNVAKATNFDPLGPDTKEQWAKAQLIIALKNMNARGAMLFEKEAQAIATSVIT